LLSIDFSSIFHVLVITFTDLAGHKKYMKTTIFGLSSDAADFAMLCVDAPSSVGMFLHLLLNKNTYSSFLYLVDTTREHFSYAITLAVPVFIVINKIDLCSRTSIQQTIGCLSYLLKHADNSIKLEPQVLEKEEDLVKAAEMFVEKKICPIFTVSCVTGENIELLKKFLNILPPRLSSKEQERLSQLPVEYRVR
jgi:GTPase